MKTNQDFAHEFVATLDEKRRTEGLLAEWAVSQAIDKKLFSSMELMLDELVTNIVLHGFEEVGDSGHIKLTMHFDGERLRATIRDNARSFDPFSVPEADTTLSVEARGIGGLGVHFVRQMATMYQWRRDGKYNEVVIEKCAGPSPKVTE